MHPKKIESFNTLDHTTRYKSFLETILVNDEVWFLQADDGLLGLRNDKNELLIPFWRDEELISYYMEETKEAEYEKTNVDLSTFVDEVLTDMIKDNQVALIDQMPAGNGAVINPNTLREDILAKIKDY